MTLSKPIHLGLIVPPAAGEVPVDGAILYGDRVRFTATGLALGEISTRGYTEVIDLVVARAAQLAKEGATSVSLMGTSLSFFRGTAFTDQLRLEMERGSGVPCTTMSHAILRGLRSVGVRRVAVATAYIDEVNDKLNTFLIDSDFEPTAIKGLSIADVNAVRSVTTQTLVDLSIDAFRAKPGADGILISCGGLVTLDAVREIEAQLKVPVVSSSPAGFWDLMQVGGQDAKSPGNGRLFA